MIERAGTPAWRAVVIEDHAEFASAVRDLVEADGSVAVEAVCHTLALGTDLVRRLRPELVLTDFRLPDGDAVEQFSVWHDASPGSRIVVTSAWTDDRSVRRARDGGAAAYVDKTSDLLELPTLIGRIMTGDEWVSPSWPPRPARADDRSTERGRPRAPAWMPRTWCSAVSSRTGRPARSLAARGSPSTRCATR